jgi:hypothetical protein
MIISFILVVSSAPGNDGTSAIVIKKMEFQSLHFINTLDCLSEPARWLAHGSAEILGYSKAEFLLKETGFNIKSANYPPLLKRSTYLKEGDICLLCSFCKMLIKEIK